MTIASGSTLGGRYLVGTLVASGGMGDVWEATDEVLQRQVAVKVMRPQGPDESFLERFRDEARSSAVLQHPNIASVFDYGEQDGTAYLVMELVPGHTLGELIREAPGGMSPDDVRSVVGQAALALAAAHDSGVVHRDVKPANIIVTPQGQVKLTDFGIARLGDGSGHTATGEVLGTPHYISPEQALGQPATSASDVYALGIVAHEMLTGTRPFDQGMPVATALAQVHDAPPPLPPTVPADLRAVVESCLAKAPAERPADARTVAAALGFGDATAATVPVGATERVEAVAPVETVGATRAMPLVTRRADLRAAQAPAPKEHSVSRRWAWLAIPLVALVAWGAFALGGLVNGGVPPTSTGGSGSSHPAATTATKPTQRTTTSASTTAATTTTKTEPTTTSATPSTSQEPTHPGKGKGRGRGN
ncbi:hypothetical protein GCM10027053_11230 [Intrasporangium mesophilum]